MPIILRHCSQCHGTQKCTRCGLSMTSLHKMSKSLFMPLEIFLPSRPSTNSVSSGNYPVLQQCSHKCSCLYHYLYTCFGAFCHRLWLLRKQMFLLRHFLMVRKTNTDRSKLVNVAEKTGRGVNVFELFGGIFYSSKSDAVSSYLVCACKLVLSESGSLNIRRETKMTQGCCSFTILLPVIT